MPIRSFLPGRLYSTSTVTLNLAQSTPFSRLTRILQVGSVPSPGLSSQNPLHFFHQRIYLAMLYLFTSLSAPRDGNKQPGTFL
jgi:hypothetical protein